MKIKLAFLISHPIQYYSPLFRELSKEPKIDLTVLYCSDESVRGMKDVGFGKDVKWDIDLLKGYKYKFLKNYSPLKTLFRPPFGLINFEIVTEISKYDAIIIHGRHYATHWLAYLAAVLKSIPVFIREETPLSQEKLKKKSLFKKIVLRNFFKQVSGCLAIGTENKKFYKSYGTSDEKIFWTPYAVDNKRFIESCKKLRKEKRKIKREIGIESYKTVILFSGKLIDKKRPFDLLKAYEKINVKNKALVFVGDGELREKLEEYSEKNNLEDVHFAGFKNQTELGKYYSAADIFVLPSGIGETWGLVVNEAMCFSLPIIVSDIVGCARDLVKQGQNGFVFSAGNIIELSKYLELLLRNQNLRQKMGKESFKMIQKWSYKEDVDGVLKSLDSIQNENPSN
jgi:glycosyltransferase involved in cell wall biosynthesis